VVDLVENVYLYLSEGAMVQKSRCRWRPSWIFLSRWSFSIKL